jgi:hypothetical protein
MRALFAQIPPRPPIAGPEPTASGRERREEFDGLAHISSGRFQLPNGRHVQSLPCSMRPASSSDHPREVQGARKRGRHRPSRAPDCALVPRGVENVVFERNADSYVDRSSRARSRRRDRRSAFGREAPENLIPAKGIACANCHGSGRPWQAASGLHEGYCPSQDGFPGNYSAPGI